MSHGQVSHNERHTPFQVSPIISCHASAPLHHPHGLFSSIAQPFHVSDCFSPSILLSPYLIHVPTASSPISSNIFVSDDLVRFHVYTQLRYDLRIISAILYINSCTSTTVPQFEYRISPHCSYQLLCAPTSSVPSTLLPRPENLHSASLVRLRALDLVSTTSPAHLRTYSFDLRKLGTEP